MAHEPWSTPSLKSGCLNGHRSILVVCFSFNCHVQVLLQKMNSRARMSTFLEVMVRTTEKPQRFMRRCAHEKEEDTLTDRILICRDCKQEILFTSSEQEFYARPLLILTSRLRQR